MDGINGNVCFGTVEDMRQKAMANGSDFYEISHDEVKNPLHINTVEKLIKDVYKGFRSFAKSQPKDLDEKTLQQKYIELQQHDKDKMKFLTETHKTIADNLMKRKVPKKVYDAILYMVKTKKIELSRYHTEKEKDNAVYRMQNDLFNSCLVPTKKEHK